MLAQRYDFQIDQGADFSMAVTYTDSNNSVFDLTVNNYIATLTIRENVEDTSAIATLTSSSGQILLASDAPNITVNIPYATTTAFDFDTAFYDLELTTNATGTLTVDKILRGKVKLIKEITR